MSLHPNFPQRIIGVDVFLERHQTRIYVGKLEKLKDKFHFIYDHIYLKTKNILPLGPEFPLTRQKFVSPHLFPSFEDRLPDPENPAYEDYCTATRIPITTIDPFILLTTIGKRGPSSFIFEPVYSPFTYKDFERIRTKELKLSLQDFSALCEVSVSILQKIKAHVASGREILQRLELFLRIPEALEFQLNRNAKWLHPRKIKNILEWIHLKKEHQRLTKLLEKSLTYQELSYTQKCLKALSNSNWAQKLIDKINAMGFSAASISTLFKIRFAYELYQASSKIQTESIEDHGKNEKEIDFQISEKNGPQWLIQLISSYETQDFKKNSFTFNDLLRFFSFSSSSNLNGNHPSFFTFIKKQQAFFNQLTNKETENLIKLPNIQPYHYNVIIFEVRDLFSEPSSTCHYQNIIDEDALQRKKVTRPETQENHLIGEIFDSHPSDERAKQVQTHIHAIGFIHEHSSIKGEILKNLHLFPNPQFFKTESEFKRLWPFNKFLTKEDS